MGKRIDIDQNCPVFDIEIYLIVKYIFHNKKVQFYFTKDFYSLAVNLYSTSIDIFRYMSLMIYMTESRYKIVKRREHLINIKN